MEGKIWGELGGLHLPNTPIFLPDSGIPRQSKQWDCGCEKEVLGCMIRI